jgi:hypothetical protein
MAQRYEYDPDDLFQSTSRSEIERWVEDIETNASVGRRKGGIDLSGAEENFLDNVRNTLDRRNGEKPLTSKQLVWLKQIFDKAEG